MSSKKVAKHKVRRKIKSKKKPKRNKISKVIIRSIVLLYFLTMIFFISFHLYYANKILPGIYVNDIEVGGLTPEQAINKMLAELPEDNYAIVRVGESHAEEITMYDISFNYLPVETAKYAFNIGREGPFLDTLMIRAKSLVLKQDILPKYSYDELALKNKLSLAELQGLEPYKEPHFEVSDADELRVIPGNVGEAYDHDEVSKDIIRTFANNENFDTSVTAFKVNPTMTVDDLELVKSEVRTLIDKNYFFKFANYTWQLSQVEEVAMIMPVKIDEDTVSLRINKKSVLGKLDEISQEINRNPKGQVLEVQDGKAVQFIEAEEGLRLLIKESADLVESGLLNNISDDVEVELAVEVTTPPPAENEYNIDDVLGIGTSKFKGSDSGRIHNIATATEKIHGVMVPPGGTFSFGEAVGEISRNTGFTSAWIISKGRTILGDGGGVCQVSTTVFRAALDAGLPIVERNAHSYRVGYYEQDSPPGIDATIYIPSVDLKFENDTDAYILIASQLNKEKTTLKFTIYGQDDGREVTITEPKVVSRSSPPAPRYIDNPNMAKGVTKQVEYPVSGAKVVFERIVERDGDILYEDVFTSNYRAWGAVYEVGTKE